MATSLNKDFERFTSLLGDLNTHLSKLKSQIEKSNSSYKEILAEKEQCSSLSVAIERLLKEGTFNKSDNLKVNKLKGDFQKMLKTYSELILKIKHIQQDQVSDLQVKSKRASVLYMSMKIKEPHHQNAPDQKQKDEFCDEEDLHQHVEHYETLMLEKNNEIKEVEKDVIAINNMMKDVAKMVQDQGEQIDHIEIDIKNTNQDVKEAEKEMISAKNYQKSYRAKMCCLLATFIGIVAIVVMVVVFVKN